MCIKADSADLNLAPKNQNDSADFSEWVIRLFRMSYQNCQTESKEFIFGILRNRLKPVQFGNFWAWPKNKISNANESAKGFLMSMNLPQDSSCQLIPHTIVKRLIILLNQVIKLMTIYNIYYKEKREFLILYWANWSD